MTSLRKKYQDFPSPADRSTPKPVGATPVTAAELPPAAEPQKPLEEIAKPSAADEAAANAIQARIAEMDRAESLAQQQAANHPRLAAEPPQPPPIEQAIASLPKRAQGWYKSHPEYFTDPEGAARMQYAHWVVKRETGEEFTDKYFDRMESLLGLQQQPPAQPKPAPTQEHKVNGHAPVSAPPAPPRNPAPVRQQQQRSGPPVSAPPTRMFLHLRAAGPQPDAPR
jgi:hypothetical protein